MTDLRSKTDRVHRQPRSPARAVAAAAALRKSDGPAGSLYLALFRLLTPFKCFCYTLQLAFSQRTTRRRVESGEILVDPDALFLRGKEAADSGNYDYAIALFLDIIKAHPEHMKSRRALRGCTVARFTEKGKSAKLSGFFGGLKYWLLAKLPGLKAQTVIDACERYLVGDPTSIGILCRLAKAYEKQGLLDAAADTLEFARQRDPDNLTVLRLLGETCRKKGEYEKSVRCFSEIVQKKPADRNAAHRMQEISAEWHLKRSHMEEAKDFTEIIKDKDAAQELMDKERIARTTDEKLSQIRKEQERVKEDRSDPKRWRDLGRAFFQAEQFDKAEKAFAEEFRLSKRYEARERLGNARLRRLRQAEQKAIEEAEKSGQAPALVAKAREITRLRRDFAIKEYSFRREHHPTDLSLAWELGKQYFERQQEGDIEAAIKQFQEAKNDAGLKHHAQLMLARCFAMRPQTLDMAKDALVQGLNEIEDVRFDIGKEMTYELAGVEEKLGARDEATKLYKKLYAMDASYRDVSKKVQELG